VIVVLVTGMSGTGESAALAALARRGHRVVDTDYGGYSEEEPVGCTYSIFLQMG
jgi:NAD(P)-dependent dehydrogenase (short-subunit alcohol dehydrogenase family)